MSAVIEWLRGPYLQRDSYVITYRNFLMLCLQKSVFVCVDLRVVCAAVTEGRTMRKDIAKRKSSR